MEKNILNRLPGRVGYQTIIIIAVLFFISCQNSVSREKPRVVILTDMTHDDGNSLIRYLYYSSWFDLEAMIITNQLPDYNHDDSGPWDKGMTILKAYQQELPQLHKHDPDLPEYDELMAVTKKGRGAIPIIWLTNSLEFKDNIAGRYVESSWDSIYFNDWVGEGLNPHGEPKDSEGSDLLVKVFEKDDDRPLFVQAWGGTITFVQALYRYRQKHGEEQFRRLLSKIHLFGILFQDITLEYFIDFDKMQNETCAGMGTAISTYDKSPVQLGTVLYDNGHFWYYVWSDEPGYQKPVTSQMVNNHGPMSEFYDNGGEGDTPAFLYLISSVLGLNDPHAPMQGSWGSMFRPMGDSFPDGYYSTCNIDRSELVRWVPDATNSFMNRLQWSVKEPGEVNREPVAVVKGDASGKIIHLAVKEGQEIKLDASDSYDPDGDAIRFNWFWYDEADTYDGDIRIDNPGDAVLSFVVPSDLSTRDIHLVLEVRDNGTPDLVAYKRIIITKNN